MSNSLNPGDASHQATLSGGRAQASDAAMPPASLTPSAGSAGAPPSNTAPANYLPPSVGTQILRYGVDSLYLSYRGALSEAVDTQLETLKQLARSEQADEQARAFLPLGNHSFEVQGRGRGKFAYVLRDGWFDLQCSRRTSEQLPLASCQIASELLTLSGLVAAARALDQVVVRLGRIDGIATVSRVDLCVDFTTDADLDGIPDGAWVTRAHRFQRYRDQGIFSGFSFGLGGDLSCRLYNKTLELKKSGKAYLFPLWRAAGWDGQATVWRLEFQFRRAVLRTCCVSSVFGLAAHLAGLWRYGVVDWLQLKAPHGDGNKTRWPLHPMWRALQAVTWGQTPVRSVTRIDKSRVPGDQFLFVNGLGAVTSFMAREGIDDFETGLTLFGKSARAYHLQHSQRTGRTLNGYTREKIALKRRRFNLAKDERHTQAQAQAYQQGKDGE